MSAKLKEYRTERDAGRALRRLLRPYFFLLSECKLQHIETGQNLRLDFLVRPKPETDFPFDLFGVEVKRGKYGANRAYNQALWQAHDYTHCQVADKRAAKASGRRIERVYLFPGLPEESKRSVWATHRLIGMGHVGQILIQTKWPGIIENPAFYMCGDRQWCPHQGAHRGKHKTRQLVGSGVIRTGGDENKRA